MVSTHLENIGQIGNLPNRDENKKYLKPPQRFYVIPKSLKVGHCLSEYRQRSFLESALKTKTGLKEHQNHPNLVDYMAN